MHWILAIENIILYYQNLWTKLTYLSAEIEATLPELDVLFFTWRSSPCQVLSPPTSTSLPWSINNENRQNYQNMDRNKSKTSQWIRRSNLKSVGSKEAGKTYSCWFSSVQGEIQQKRVLKPPQIWLKQALCHFYLLPWYKSTYESTWKIEREREIIIHRSSSSSSSIYIAKTTNISQPNIYINRQQEHIYIEEPAKPTYRINLDSKKT